MKAEEELVLVSAHGEYNNGGDRDTAYLQKDVEKGKEPEEEECPDAWTFTKVKNLVFDIIGNQLFLCA